MLEEDSSQRLIAILQLAYSGERAAAYAYRGHWRSVADKNGRKRIAEIENEEWHNRVVSQFQFLCVTSVFSVSLW